MVSEFGKELIKLREKNNQTIIDMSLKLDVELSKLSRLEQSKELIDDGFLDILFKVYCLSALDKKSFIEKSKKSNEIYDNIKNKTDIQNDILSRKIISNDDLINELRGILNGQN